MIFAQVSNLQVSPREWIELIYDYGPFALLVMFMLVAQFISYRNLRRSVPENRRIHQSIFVANWLVIFALAAFSTFAWYSSSLAQDNYNVLLRVRLHPEENTIEEKNIQVTVFDANLKERDVPTPNIIFGLDGLFNVAFTGLGRGDQMQIRVVVDGEEMAKQMIPVPPASIYDLRLKNP